MSLNADLLEQASHLARRERRRPKQASLRRAISTAYDALFHLLIHEAAQLLVTGNNRKRLRLRVHRAFVHSEMKEVAAHFAGGSPTRWQSTFEPLTVQVELQDVAEAFKELQQARHEADYDLDRRFAKRETTDLVALASKAFDDWKQVRGTLQADAFLLALLTHKHIKG